VLDPERELHYGGRERELISDDFEKQGREWG
jgi:hypothetical protein